MKTFEKFLNEDQSTMQVWHGGHLENDENFIEHGAGRYEFGAGLYTTTHYGTARKFQRGCRKMYLITLNKGTHLDEVDLKTIDCKKFIDDFCKEHEKCSTHSTIDGYGETIPARHFNNLIVNHQLIEPKYASELRRFFINNGIDYIFEYNSFGVGDMMIVVLNMDKIAEKQIVKPNDEIQKIDLPHVWRNTSWS